MRLALAAIVAASIVPTVVAAVEHAETVPMGEFRSYEVRVPERTVLRFGAMFEDVETEAPRLLSYSLLEGPSTAASIVAYAYHDPEGNATTVHVLDHREHAGERGGVTLGWLSGLVVGGGTYRLVIATPPAEATARYVVRADAPIEVELVSSGLAGYASAVADGPAGVDVERDDGTRRWAHAGHVRAFETEHGLYGHTRGQATFVSTTDVPAAPWSGSTWRGDPGPWVLVMAPGASYHECAPPVRTCERRDPSFAIWVDVPPCELFEACGRP